MTLKISKSKFKATALECFRIIQSTQEDIIITDRGKPVLRISPYSEDPEQALNTLQGSVIQFFDPTLPVALEDWNVLK